MDNRILFGIMTIVFNPVGVPCFMQGKVKVGVLRIVLNVLTYGIVGVINQVFGIIQGIKILCMSDADYAAVNKATLLTGFPSEELSDKITVDNRVFFAIITIVCNGIGVPHLLLGKVKAGILRIVLCLVTLGVFGIINTVHGIIQGIKILKMLDADYATIDKTTLLVGIPADN